MVNTFSASLPVHSHVARPSTEEEQVAALVATGKITTSTMWRTVGAVPFNSQVVFKAAAELEAAEAAVAAEKESGGDCGGSGGGGGGGEEGGEDAGRGDVR